MPFYNSVSLKIILCVCNSVSTGSAKWKDYRDVLTCFIYFPSRISLAAMPLAGMWFYHRCVNAVFTLYNEATANGFVLFISNSAFVKHHNHVFVTRL